MGCCYVQRGTTKFALEMCPGFGPKNYGHLTDGGRRCSHVRENEWRIKRCLNLERLGEFDSLLLGMLSIDFSVRNTTLLMLEHILHQRSR